MKPGGLRTIMLRKTRIICTVGRLTEDEVGKTIRKFIDAGMDVARINMAHFNVGDRSDARYLRNLIRVIRIEAKKSEKEVAILGDVQGPKVRIKDFFVDGMKSEKVDLTLGEQFILTSKKSLSARKGASISYEGAFNFFKSVRENVEKDAAGKNKPIEFWFGDGKVILDTLPSNISKDSAVCTVKVAGEIRGRKGISVKNSKIDPGEYLLDKYEKDQEDIRFLLSQDVDMLALSFVNSAKDVENLQAFVRLAIENKRKIEDVLGVLDRFPVISKIESWDGYRNLDEIMDVSYGIIIGRGDLALQTGIERVGILQKDIIERCIAEGKPVITATQMLLSMMDFIEPRRSEVADVTNAVTDGSDALMLSEETADQGSKYPVESIEIMKRIIIITEGKRAASRIDYKYELDKLHAKTIETLGKRKARVNKECKEQGKNHDHSQCKSRKCAIRNMENTEHIAYDACKTAFELECKAIIVSTDTGRTARMISRFGPDMPILAGVTTSPRVARILRMSYGVEPFIITPNLKDPFNELEQVIKQARSSKRLRIDYQEYRKIWDEEKKREPLENEDRIIFVAGYPARPGTTTFMDIHEIT